ncbi:hypothetical protein KL929_002821 [Ogataea haglerorum]|nr:hypothetical protein KL929_002821 [Ogataea haglerorum]
MLSLAILGLVGTCFAEGESKSFSEYSWPELADMSLLDRLKLYPWKLEMVSVGFIAAYVLTFFIGSKYNEKLVNNFLNANLDLLKEQFSQVGVTRSKLLAKDDSEHYAFYATGRLNIESLTAKFKLQPRQNVFIWFLELVFDFFAGAVAPLQDVVDLTFQIDSQAGSNYDDFIWAIVSKDNMNQLRKDNYFLSLTKTSESNKLPVEFVFMNEVPEMNEVLHHKKFNAVLEKCKSFLKFVAVTDQSSEKPETVSDTTPSKKIVVQLRIPKSSAELEAAHELLKFLLNDYIDYVVSKASFRAELTRRCKKTREAEVSKLRKLEEDLKKEQLAAKKLEDQKKQKAGSDADEQRKHEKKQLERKQRRQMGKQKIRQ